ncbi:hypothetical protein B0H13DRAFT_2302564 [Mycena leptocephala]|nr:hypothetical protein B0H13DRAFT_2302564 [Mycena leptocephala]
MAAQRGRHHVTNNVTGIPPLPEPLPPLSQHQPRTGLSLRPADLLGLLLPLHPDDPFHPDDVPSIELPAPSFCPCPADHCELPADTDYGTEIDDIENSLYSTLSALIDTPQPWDDFDESSNLLSFKKFTDYVLIPHVAATLISEDMECSLEDTLDILDDSRRCGQILFPDSVKKADVFVTPMNALPPTAPPRHRKQVNLISPKQKTVTLDDFPPPDVKTKASKAQAKIPPQKLKTEIKSEKVKKSAAKQDTKKKETKKEKKMGEETARRSTRNAVPKPRSKSVLLSIYLYVG